MRMRLVSPVNRKGTHNIQFVQRIPADVKARAAGLKLSIPIGAEVHPLTISLNADAVRVSLRTSDRSTAKARQGQVASYVETVWQALRGAKPDLLDPLGGHGLGWRTVSSVVRRKAPARYRH